MMFYMDLSKLKLFQGISRASILALEKLPIVRRHYKAGEVVATFGDELRSIYVIISGCLKTSEFTINGGEIVSSYYNAYDAFPFYLVYSEVHYLPYTITCHKDAEVLLLPSRDLQSIIKEDASFMENVLIFVSKYCNYNKKVIRTTTYPKVSQRLAFWFLSSTGTDGIFRMPGTQEVFADILQTNRSTLSLELNKLKKEGLIKVSRRYVTLLDRGALEKLIS